MYEKFDFFCGYYIFLSLNVFIRHYSYKHNVCSWLNETIPKDYILIHENFDFTVHKKNLKQLLNNIHLNKMNYIYNMNIYMNEFLNNYKMIGGITRKKLNQ